MIPAAGNGVRFRDFGYDKPKPLIHISGRPMIEWSVNSVRTEAHYIFLAKELSHIPPMGLADSMVITVEKHTEGAACTALLAREFIDKDEPLLIVNCDQFIRWDFHAFLAWAYGTGGNGIVTFRASHPKWSYVKTEGGRVVEVKEKQVISDQATAGIYFWKSGKDFVQSALRMIEANDRTNGEFYVAPSFNYTKTPTYTYEVPASHVHGLGTPEDVTKFMDYITEQIYA